MLNPYLPENHQDIDNLADDATDLACEMFETEEPTPEQLEAAVRELENMGELYASYL